MEQHDRQASLKIRSQLLVFYFYFRQSGREIVIRTVENVLSIDPCTEKENHEQPLINLNKLLCFSLKTENLTLLFLHTQKLLITYVSALCLISHYL